MSDIEESKTEFTKKTELDQLLSEYSPNLENEYLLQEVENRFTLFPIKIPKAYEMYKKAVATLWVVEDVPLGNDISDWENKLNDNERNFIKNVLAFFAGSDGIVLENLAERFMKDIQHPEIRAFYGFQIAIENIHSEMYSLLIDTYIKDADEKHRLFNAITTIPCVSKKAKWAQKWIHDKKASFPIRLIAFAIVEGIFFSGSFCAIYWLKKRNLMQGLTLSNEWISSDEGLHTDFAIMLSHMISDENAVPEEIVHAMIKEAVEIELEFIIDSIPCAMIGMNSKLMSQYIKYVADVLVSQLGYETIYKSTNPFEFMELMSLEGKTNFFEAKNSSYNKANASNSLRKDDKTGSNDENKNNSNKGFTFNADF
jgi:ribonucleotide reductase beta subunit family protein with ferritin-like domain